MTLTPRDEKTLELADKYADALGSRDGFGSGKARAALIAHLEETGMGEPVAWQSRDGSKCIPADEKQVSAKAINPAEHLARRFHEAYERFAPLFGYNTREETRTFDPASPNGKLMIAVCTEVLGATETARKEVSAAGGDDARDAKRYRHLRRKFCIVVDDGGAKFHALNLPAPRYPAPDPSIEFDAAIDAEIARAATGNAQGGK